jgi:protein SCO1/2
LVQALDNLRGRDAPVRLLSDADGSTALLEILAALRWQPSVSPALVAAVTELHDRHSSSWSDPVRAASQQTVAELRARAQRSPLTLADTPALMILGEAAEATGDLRGVTVQDHDGRVLPVADYLGRADTVVAFFYTRCQNPNKCSLTITKLGDLQRRLSDDPGLAGIQLTAITYDPGFDRPDRLAAYARARGMILGDTVRMLRAVEGHDQLRRFFGLRVGYNGSIVNQHGVELYLVDRRLEIVRTWARVPWEVADVAAALIDR